MKEFIKHNSKVLILLVIVILLGAIGLTLAYTMKDINVAIESGVYNVVYTGSSTLPSANLTPILDSELTSSNNSSKVLKIDFTVKGAESNPTGKDIIYDVSLTDLDLPTELRSSLLKWRLYKNGTQISEGSFSKDFDLLINNRMVLTEIQQDLPNYSSTADSYVFYVWISEACTGDITTCTENDDTTPLMNKTFSGNIRIELSTGSKKELVRIPTANSPNLVDNSLVPVYYDENASTWKVASYTNEDNNWYNYDEKKWANAVLLTEDKRNSLTKDEDGNYTQNQIIGDTEASGTLAFYVWIPRYKYKVWNIDKEMKVDSYNAYDKGIDIVFETGTSSTGTISCEYDFGFTIGEEIPETCTGNNGDYYTHPAFTFGNDEVTGIWVGKFEVADINGSFSEQSIITPIVLPNVMTSWHYNDFDFSWYSIYNMQKENNIYGLPTSRVSGDSHMLTNMEWGAIAYFTYSKYGVCDEYGCGLISETVSNEYALNITGLNSGNKNIINLSKNYYEYNENEISKEYVKNTGVNVSFDSPRGYNWEENNGVWSSGVMYDDFYGESMYGVSELVFEFTLESIGMLSFDYSYSGEKICGLLEYRISNYNDIDYRVEFNTGIELGTIEEELIYKKVNHILNPGTYEVKINRYSQSSFCGEVYNSSNKINKAFIKNIIVLDNINYIEKNIPSGQFASTTGNIYGIYDMVGGLSELVYGVFSSTDGVYTFSPDFISSNGSYYTYSGFEKYLTTYASLYGDLGFYHEDNGADVLKLSRLGDAINEIILFSYVELSGNERFESWYNSPGLIRGYSLTRGSSNIFGVGDLADGSSAFVTRAALIGF